MNVAYLDFDKVSSTVSHAIVTGLWKHRLGVDSEVDWIRGLSSV